MKKKARLSPLKCIFIFLIFFNIISCGSNKKKVKTNASNLKEKNRVDTALPSFNKDSAFDFIKAQTDFGPRVPNTKAHELCLDYLRTKFQNYGAKIYTQKVDLKAYNGEILHSTNIIASFHPEKNNRIFISSHWDSRPYADHDLDSKNWNTPIDGANDGASGVGVILELARLISTSSPNIGVDFILFDSEDYGAPEFYKGKKSEDDWCLGSQYWSRNTHVANYYPRYGILLDMVGGVNATFHYEYFSMNYASSVVEKVWDEASKLGYSDYFKSSMGGGITDDHVPINKIAGIKCIDIIDYNQNNPNGFYYYWHTLNDNIQNISKETLGVVGKTLVQVIYNEK